MRLVDTINSKIYEQYLYNLLRQFLKSANLVGLSLTVAAHVPVRTVGFGRRRTVTVQPRHLFHQPSLVIREEKRREAVIKEKRSGYKRRCYKRKEAVIRGE